MANDGYHWLGYRNGYTHGPRKDTRMSKTFTPRRAHAVVWISDELENDAGIDPVIAAITAMREKVLPMLAAGEGAHLVEARRVDPMDPEFHRLAQAEGHVPEGCSLWFGVWQTSPRRTR